MILPKGTVDFSKKGGEDSMVEIIEDINKEQRTGYILIMGTVDNLEGDKEDITAQLVFQEGEPKLCEAIVNKNSHKGSPGIHYLLRSMMNPENEIEMHSKIDVGPPLAFFKECKFDPGELDLDSFKKKIKEEEEERRRREEEKRKREEQETNIRNEVENWISSGFRVEGFPDIMESSHEEIVNWHKELSSNISEVRSVLEWSRGIEEVEVNDLKDKLIEKAKEPTNMEEIRNAKNDLEATLSDINDKRKEMEKWVNLWKDEGYNTEKIEESLKADLTTAWNNLTHFMDDIQKLKDHKDELEQIRENDPNDHFGPEIREIDFLLNDPMEIQNIEKLLGELKETIEKEREEKDRLMENTLEWEEKGYSLEGLKKHQDERLDSLRKEQATTIQNLKRMDQIKEELASLDRRDLAGEIDGLTKGLKDPYQIEDYESGLKDLKERIEVLNSKRNAISDELKQLSAEGFLNDTVEKEMDSPVDKLTAMFEGFKADVKILRSLKERVSEMDHRWLEDDFNNLDPLLNDVSKIDDIKTAIEDLDKRIQERENERSRIREEMNKWKDEGFDVSGLEEVIEEDLEVFTAVYKDIAQNISRAKEELASLRTMNVKFFPAEAQEIEKDLHDPQLLERTIENLNTFKQKVSEDWNTRNKLRGRLDELKEKNWALGSLESIMDTSPDLINGKIEDLETRVSQLEEAMQEVEEWDPLESNWLSGGINDLKEHLMKIEDRDSALEHFKDLEEKIGSNKNKRAEMLSQLNEWKEAGYVTHGAQEKSESAIEELKEAFNDLRERIGKLENLQARYDSLKIDHFRSEAEEIEFKMNDPYLVDEIEVEMESLEEKINKDEEKRSEFRGKIEDYLEEGFMGAKKLEDFMDEDISIVELEFRNFEKEVQLFRKYMKSVGFVFPKTTDQTKSEDKKEKAEKKDEEPIEGESEEKEEEHEEAPSQKQWDFQMNFDNFIVGTPNEIANTAAADVAADPGQTYNPLLILGDMGVGKTHLVSAIASKIDQERPKMNLLFTDGRSFINDMKVHREKGKMEDFRDRFRESDMLILDDLHQLKESEDSQEMFINILNAFLDNEKQVVLTAQRDIKSIPMLVEQIRSRLDKGVSVDLEATTPEINSKIIESIGGGKIPDDVKEHFSSQLGNVNDIKIAVGHYLDESKNGDPGLEKAKDIVDKITGDPGHRKLTEALEDTLKNIQDEKSEVVLCTNCNKEIAADSSECPHCGAIFEDVEMKECPVCKKHIEMDATECPNCGMELS